MHAVRNIGVCLAASAMIGLGNIASAQTVIGNFETPALDGWGTNGGPGSPTLTQGTVGVTLGSFSLDSTIAQGSFWGPSTGNLANATDISAMENSTQLSYDMTLDALYINGGSFSGYAQSNAMAIQLYSPTANAGGVLNLFMQESFGAGDTDSSGENAEWNGVDGTRHITWSLANFTATDPNTGTAKTVDQFLTAYGSQITSMQIDFVEQVGGGTAATSSFFFDDVALNGSPAPEPATMALLGLGAAALIRRRARK